MSASRTLAGMIATYPYTSVWNMTGQPACSVPAPTLSRDGLPLGRAARRPARRRGRAAVAGGAAGGRDRLARPPSADLLARTLPSVRTVQIHDTLSGGLRPLEPREPGRVGIYACGPTVYARIHVGNARPYVVFSLLKRFLEHEGYDATLVINVTDVNDKIYDAARERGIESAELAREMTDAYERDTGRLGLGRPDAEPQGQRDGAGDRRPDRVAGGLRPRLRGRRRRLLRASPASTATASSPTGRCEEMQQGEGDDAAAVKRAPAGLRALEGVQAGGGQQVVLALGRRAGPAGTSSARRWPRRSSASTSRSTAAARTSSSRTTRTRSPRPRPPARARSRGSGCTTGWSSSSARRWPSRSATSSCCTTRSTSSAARRS